MTHGGKREGAGRTQGSTKYGESTKPIRIPVSRISDVKAFLTSNIENPFNIGNPLIPLFSSSVKAGLPTDAEDYIEDYVDLNKLLSNETGATFLVRASGDSMINTPIFEGDMLVVERNNSPPSGKIVIAALDGELTVKKMIVEHDQVLLIAENKNYAPIVVKDSSTLKILGVVTNEVTR